VVAEKRKIIDNQASKKHATKKRKSEHISREEYYLYFQLCSFLLRSPFSSPRKQQKSNIMRSN
jgi:hypothetical protein